MSCRARRLGRPLLLLAALALALLGPIVSPQCALACSCAQISLQEHLDGSEVAFVGTVITSDKRRRGDDRWVDVRYRVESVYKGEVFAEQVIAESVPDHMCNGATPLAGTRWLVFASPTLKGSGDRTLSRLTVSSCGGSQSVPADVSDLGEPRQPQPGNSDGAEAAEDADFALDRGLLIGGVATLSLVVVAGTGVALLWWRRRGL